MSHVKFLNQSIFVRLGNVYTNLNFYRHVVCKMSQLLSSLMEGIQYKSL